MPTVLLTFLKGAFLDYNTLQNSANRVIWYLALANMVYFW